MAKLNIRQPRSFSQQYSDALSFAFLNAGRLIPAILIIVLFTSVFAAFLASLSIEPYFNLLKDTLLIEEYSWSWQNAIESIVLFFVYIIITALQIILYALLFLIVFLGLSAAFNSWAYVGVTHAYMGLYESTPQKPSFGALMNAFMKKAHYYAGRLAVFFLAALAASFLSGALLFIPAPFALYFLYLALLVSLDQDAGPIESLKKAKKLLKGRFWASIGGALLFMLTAVAAVAVLNGGLYLISSALSAIFENINPMIITERGASAPFDFELGAKGSVFILAFILSLEGIFISLPFAYVFIALNLQYHSLAAQAEDKPIH